MGQNIESVGTIFRGTVDMGSSGNYRAEHFDTPKGSNDIMRYFGFGNFIHNVFSSLKQDMATVKLGWALCNIFGIPAIILTVFPHILNIQMTEPYKDILGVLALVYAFVLIIRSSLKAHEQKISNDKKAWDLKKEKEEYVKKNGYPKASR